MMNPKAIAGFLTGLLSFLLIGCESTRTQSAAPQSSVDTHSGLNAAMIVSAGGQGRVTGQGVGDSMAPLYGKNTLVVTSPIDFDQLEAGMIVAYRNRSGRHIVHKLAYKQGNTWVAIGINNQNVDLERVTRENLVGVVYATFHTAEEN